MKVHVFRSAIQRISSLAEYFYTKTVSNYNLEYANFETTQVSNYNNLLFIYKKKYCYIERYLLLTTKRKFHILIIILFTCRDVWVVRMTPAPKQHTVLH